MTMGAVDRLLNTIEHELCATRMVLALYEVLPKPKQMDLNRQYPDFKRKLDEGVKRHDFGKRAWPTDLLCSDRHPTREEWYEWVIPHPAVSAKHFHKLIKPDRVIEEMILYHHVRYDGLFVQGITPDGRRVPDYAGYPGGIGGDDIPFGARMLKICDAVSAMVRKRNYRSREILAEEAIQQVHDRAGTEYDPMLAMLFSERFTPLMVNRLAYEEKN